MRLQCTQQTTHLLQSITESERQGQRWASLLKRWGQRLWPFLSFIERVYMSSLLHKTVLKTTAAVESFFYVRPESNFRVWQSFSCTGSEQSVSMWSGLTDCQSNLISTPVPAFLKFTLTLFCSQCQSYCLCSLVSLPTHASSHSNRSSTWTNSVFDSILPLPGNIQSHPNNSSCRGLHATPNYPSRHRHVLSSDPVQMKINVK